MRFVMLARNPLLYSHQRLIAAARARGHELDVLNTLHVHMNITSSRPLLRYGGKSVPRYDAVVPRIGASVTHYGLAVLRQFEMLGIYPLNESVAIGRSRDKLRALQILAREGIGMPVTAFAHGPRRALNVINEVGGVPVVIKLLEGAQGMGVILAETEASAKSIVEAFSAANVNIMVQEFIDVPDASDIRALVVGGRVVAAIKRTGQSGEFRSNLHRGGRAEAVEITPAERDTAVRAAAALGLNACGVDMLRSERGPLVMEVNSSPGLRGIEEATGIDAAGSIIAFLEAHARPGETETKGERLSAATQRRDRGPAGRRLPAARCADVRPRPGPLHRRIHEVQKPAGDLDSVRLGWRVARSSPRGPISWDSSRRKAGDGHQDSA